MKFKEYYPIYLSKHLNFWTRFTHYVGIWMTIFYIGCCIGLGVWWMWLFVPFVTYPFAWAGHLLIEGNMPAAFKNPILAKRADFYMYWSEMTGKLPEQFKEARKTILFEKEKSKFFKLCAKVVKDAEGSQKSPLATRKVGEIWTRTHEK